MCAERTSYASFGYGRYQARVLFPGGAALGDWPAFWTVGAGMQWPAGGEIDIAEVSGWPGAAPAGRVCATYHYGLPGAPVSTSTVCAPALAAGWHVYGVVWAPHRLVFSVDGRRYAVFRGAFIAGVLQHVLFDLTDAVPGQAETVGVAWFRHQHRA